jgi:hypothetical protein
MATSREILESTYQAGRMKKMRTFVYASHVVLAIILFIIMAFMTEGAGTYIFVVPVELIIFIVALILLIVNLESFFFKLFGIKYAKTDSEKFLMIKDYFKKGIIIVIVAMIIFALGYIIFPMSGENINSSDKAVMSFEKPQYNVTFRPRDPFGTINLKKIIVEQPDGNALLDIFILHESDFHSNYFGKRLNIQEEQSRDLIGLEYEFKGYIPQDDYVLFIDSKGVLANVTYIFERKISPPLVMYITFFPILFVMANAAWVVYLFPKRKRFEKTSIYK